MPGTHTTIGLLRRLAASGVLFLLCGNTAAQGVSNASNGQANAPDTPAARKTGETVGSATGQVSPAGRDTGVIVLEENDFDKVPEAVRGQSLSGTGAALAAPASGPAEVNSFDPRRDASQDIRRAVAAASRQGKHVLLEVGGNWCPYCKVLDQFFVANPELDRLRQQNFVFVKVNFSQENQNEQALGQYPLIRGYPHFFVLNGKGELMRSQRVATLGTNTGYSPERFRSFLHSLAPKR